MTKPTLDPISPPTPTFNQQLLAAIPSLRQYALALTHVPDDAQDLVQTTLLHALRKHHLFIPETNLPAWCRTLMHHLNVNRIRAGRRQRYFEETLSMVTTGTTQAPTQDLTLLVIETLNAIKSLPPPQREILTTLIPNAHENNSYEFVTRTLGIPIGTTGSRLARARQALRELTDR